MIRALIIDDEESARKTLRGLLLNACPQVQVIGEAASAQRAMEAIAEQQPDLLFLDIRMPFGNGIELMQQYNAPAFEVIFTTAYSEYALHALRLSALDYLLKPIDMEELQASVNKAERAMALKGTNERFLTLLRNLKQERDARVVLPYSGGYQISSFAEIVRLQAENNYSWVIFANGSRLLCSRTLKDFESLLREHGFLRVHQSHLVNQHCIRAYQKGRGGQLILTNGETVEVARSRKRTVLQFIDQL